MKEKAGLTFDKDPVEPNSPKTSARISVDLLPVEKEQVLNVLFSKYPRTTQQGAVKRMMEDFLGISLS